MLHVVDARMDRSSRLWLLLLLLVAAAVRLGWAWSRPTDDAALLALPDQVEYLDLARNLRGGDGLRFFDPRFRDHVYAYRSAGYPIFIAALGSEPRTVRVVQSILDTCSVLAAFLLARRWLSPRASLLAGALAAFSPYFIYFSGLLLSETLFTLLLAWAIVLLTLNRAGPRHAAVGWWAGVVLLGLAVHVRPSAVALPVVLGVASVLALPLPSIAPGWLRLHTAAAAALVTVLVLLPWAWRNHLVLGHWVWTSTNGGMTLYDGLHPDATGASDQSFVQRLPQLQLMDEVERDRHLRRMAFDAAAADPLRAIELAGVKAARMWSPFPSSKEYHGQRLYVLAGLCFSVPLFVLALLGVARGALPRGARALLLAPAVYLTIVHAVSVGSLRYRVPADLPLCVLAASGVTAWRGRRDRPSPTVANDRCE